MQNSTQNTPTVSVIMPVYNVALYVERCLQSVMRQTYPAIECIIVDDASPDDSINLCKSLIDKYTGPTRFIILHHSHNQGLSAARNTGTNIATSDYIYYVDSDDELTLDCLEKLVAPVIKDDTIEMVLGAYKVDIDMMSNLGRCLNLSRVLFFKNMPSELRNNDDIYRWYYSKIRPLCVWNKLLKLSFVKEKKLYNKEGILFEDILWTFYLIRFLNHAAFVHHVTYLYHRNKNSIRSAAQNEERTRHISIIFKEITDQIENGRRKDETARWAYLFGGCYINVPKSILFRHIYDVFRQELLTNHQYFAFYRLTLIHYLSKCKLGRVLFKLSMKLKHLIICIMDMIALYK